MIEFVLMYITLYTAASYGIYLKYKQTVADAKLLELTFRSIAFTTQIYTVSVAFIMHYIWTFESSTEYIILACPLISYFIFDIFSMSLYETFVSALPFLLHHMVAICVGAYGFSASTEYREIAKVIVILFEFTAAIINLQWLLEHLKYTNTHIYKLNGWLILISFPLFRFGLYFAFLYGNFSILPTTDAYVISIFSLLISIYNLIAYPQVVTFCLPAIISVKHN